MQAHDTDRTKYDARDYRVQCVECGTIFEATRSDASFCSSRCRQRNYRAPQRLQTALDDIHFASVRLSEHANTYKTNEKVYQAMLAHRQQLDTLLAAFENKT